MTRGWFGRQTEWLADSARATTRSNMSSQPSAAGGVDAAHDPRTNMEIAVVIPMRDAEDTIATQLDALARQTYRGTWELVVADNGSRDRSAEIVRGYRDRLAVRIVDASQRAGAGHARNVGARASSAPLLAFVDADDEVAPDWMAAIVDALGRHPAVASRFDKERLNPPDVRASRNLAQETALGDHNYAPFLPHAGGSGLAVHRSVHDEIGGFDEALLRLEDTDYCWRIQLAGYPIHFEPDAELHVRFRPESRASLRQAFTYGRYNGRLYVHYRSRGMGAVPLHRTLKQIAILLAKLPFTRDPARRVKRRRTVANLTGIALGRIEARRRKR